MQYLFVLGRDPELAKLEVESLFETEGISYKIVDDSKSVLALDTTSIKPSMIDELGGVVKIAEVISNSNRIEDIEINLEDNILYNGKSNKIVYYISPFNTGLLSFVEDLLKDYFKIMKLKAVYKKDGTPSKLVSKDILNKGVDLVIFKNFIGKTIAITNPKELKMRDVSRPNVDYKKVISLRLAKILVNISKVKKEEVLLDPFCGSGSILQEALLKGINVIGADDDLESIKQAEDNLKWFVKTYSIKNSFKLIKINCRKISENLTASSIDGVVTEPYMGPYIRKLPSVSEARKLTLELSGLYNDLLRSLKMIVKKGRRVVIIIPRFKTRENNSVFLDFNSIAERNSFSLVTKPVKYGYKESKLLRDIYVLEKE